MLNSFQQFLVTACIGHTEDDTDPSVSDVQQRDEHQTESEIAADDNSTNDAESAVSDTSDTPVSEPPEIDSSLPAPSESEETPLADDMAPVAIDDDSPETQPDSEVLPISTDEKAHVSEDDSPGAPSTAETPAAEIADLTPADDTAIASSEDADPVSEDKTECATEIGISEQENEGAIAQHAQVSDVEADKGEAPSGKSEEVRRKPHAKTPQAIRRKTPRKNTRPQETDGGGDTETAEETPPLSVRHY